MHWSTLLHTPLLVLPVILICGSYVHFRGRERHRITRQLTDHSTLLSPYNCLIYLFSAVPRKPVLDARDFPELAPLREHWETLRDDARALVEAGHVKASEERNDIAFNSFFKRGWTRFYLKWYGAPLSSARELCPRSVELVESIPSINAALFAMMKPRSKLGKHRDPFAGSLRYHLGLDTPNSDECRIYIDGEPYSWRDGEDLLFDETYIHNVRNDTDEHRLILLCDVRRPIRFAPVRWLNAFVSTYVAPITATRNVPTERVGVVNRISSMIYAIKRFGRWFKKANRPVYEVCKWTVYAAIFYLVFLGHLHIHEGGFRWVWW